MLGSYYSGQSYLGQSGIGKVVKRTRVRIPPKIYSPKETGPMVRNRAPVTGQGIKDKVRKLFYKLPGQSALVDDPVALCDDATVLAGRFIDYMEVPLDPKIKNDIIRADTKSNKPKGVRIWRNSPRRYPRSQTSIQMPHLQ